MRFDAKTWREMEKQARNSGWNFAALTPEQIIDLWERASGYNWQRYCRNKSEVHEMHCKLREAPEELTPAELNTVRQWNGVVPATTLAAHGLEGPMGWPSFIDHLERVKDESLNWRR